MATDTESVRSRRVRVPARRSVSYAALVLAVSACGGGAPSHVESPESGAVVAPSPPVIPLGPSHLLIPAGAEAVAVLSPRTIVGADAFRRVIEPAISTEWVQTYEQQSGVNLHAVETMVIGAYEDGFLVLIEGPWNAREIVRRNGDRMTMVDVRSDEPFVRRGGFLGTSRAELIALSDDVALMARGAPQALAELLERASTGVWPAGASAALSTADVAPLVGDSMPGPLVVFAPKPLNLPEESGLGLVLAGERAMRLVVTPEGTDAIGAAIDMRGEFPESVESNFRSFFDSIAGNPMGLALGLGEARRTLRISTAPDHVELRFAIATNVLVAASQLFFAPQLREILDTSAP